MIQWRQWRQVNKWAGVPAFVEGQRAYSNGKTLLENPYRQEYSPDSREAWAAGWNNASESRQKFESKYLESAGSSSSVTIARAVAPKVALRIDEPRDLRSRQRPRPTDFGVTDRDVEAMAKYEEDRFSKFKWPLALSFLVWLFYFLGNVDLPDSLATFTPSIKEPLELLALVPVVLFIALPYFIVLVLITAALLSVPVAWIDRYLHPPPPQLEAVRRFKKAVAEFDKWWKLTQETYWRSLTGLQFEVELARLFSQMGWQAEVTRASGDGGIDIEVRRFGKRTVVQCKARRAPVGPAAARELYGVLTAACADDAILASLSGFSPAVRQFVAGKNIELIDLDWILKHQQKLAT